METREEGAAWLGEAHGGGRGRRGAVAEGERREGDRERPGERGVEKKKNYDIWAPRLGSWYGVEI